MGSIFRFSILVSIGLLSACGASTGGGGVGPGVGPGLPCTPATQADACAISGGASLHLRCDVATKAWAILETCAQGSTCTSVVNAGIAGFICKVSATADVSFTDGQDSDGKSDFTDGSMDGLEPDVVSGSDVLTIDDTQEEVVQDVVIITKDTGKDIAKDVPKDVPKDTGPPADDSFDGAQFLSLNQAISDNLDPTGDVDFYQFSGTKGQVLYIATMAQTNSPYDPDYLDTIVTLYDQNQQPIAMNDDLLGGKDNDSGLLTVLPTTGIYYVKVEECWTWMAENGNPSDLTCAGTADKGTTSYSVQVVDVSTSPAIAKEVEKGNVPSAATAIPLVKDASAKYIWPTIIGTFANTSDIDVWSFTIPSDVPVTSGRQTGFFSLIPGGVKGDGSTASLGDAWIVSAGATSSVIARSDFSVTSDLSPPLTFGQPYYLFVLRGSGSITKNEFYAIDIVAGGSNPLEPTSGSNDTQGSASPFTTAANGNFRNGYFEGDLTSSASDVDWWSTSVPSGFGGGKFSVFCGAQSSGSGLRQFTVAVYSGSTSIGGLLEPDSGIQLTNLSTPSSGSVSFKMTAGSQASDVSSTFYRCGVRFTMP